MVHLGPGETRHLVVYHAVTSTLCLLLPAAPATQVTICRDSNKPSRKLQFYNDGEGPYKTRVASDTSFKEGYFFGAFSILPNTSFLL